MKRSLKIHIFFHVLIVASVIVVANRHIAQWLMLDQMKELLRTELQTSFATCESEINHAEDFYSCHRKINPGDILNSFSDSYVLCPSQTQSAVSARPKECELGSPKSALWTHSQQLQQGSLELSSKDINDEVWIGVRRVGAPDEGPMLLVNESAALILLKQMWSYRDRNLVYSLPMIVAMLMTMAIYLAYLLTRAIATLEVAVTKMNANNLDAAQHIEAPYREFDKLLAVFEDLRQRLLESFAKTRRFAADASHELRTPLTILRGNSELMINELPVGSKIYDQVNKIHGEAERLIEITEKLLMLSRADANNIVLAATNMDVSEFLNELIEEGGESFPDIKFSSVIPPHVNWQCDEALMAQLIHNLYANAIKYNKPNGWVHLALHQTNKVIEIKVSNSTNHIPHDLNERAFERFYRGNFAHSRQADGQGLGLSIALEIAKVHQGKLSIQAQDGAVSVTFEAPLSRLL